LVVCAAGLVEASCASASLPPAAEASYASTELHIAFKYPIHLAVSDIEPRELGILLDGHWLVFSSAAASEPVALLSLMSSGEYSALASAFPGPAAAATLVNGHTVVQSVGLPSPFPESLDYAWAAIVVDADGGVMLFGLRGPSEEQQELVAAVARTLQRVEG